MWTIIKPLIYYYSYSFVSSNGRACFYTEQIGFVLQLISKEIIKTLHLFENQHYD